MHTVTRRSFVMGVSAAALLPASRLAAEKVGLASTTLSASNYLFLLPGEAQFVEAACDRLIPAEAPKFGALGAGAPSFIDAQLAGPWGRGESPYREGSCQRFVSFATPSSVAPAAFFRNALQGILERWRRDGLSFVHQAPGDQDRLLSTLCGALGPFQTSRRAFFDLLLQLTVEAFMSTPRSGTPTDRIPWQMSGFPAAYARGAK
jgi:gluconate 2-dehydrogenase gamma chain